MARLAAVFAAAAGGTWREQPTRVLLATLGIALGVALGVAVHLINASAANEFSLAVRELAGEASIVVRSGRSGLPEALFAQLARTAGVAAASPAVEIEPQIGGRRETIKVIGIDPFRAGDVQRDLLPDSRDTITELLKPRTVVLSQTAAAELGVERGGTLRLHAGSGIVQFRVVDVLPAGRTRQRLAIVDIANAQWEFARLGVLHRIDLKLSPGTDVARFRDRIAKALPAGAIASTPDLEVERNASLSRAYRLNLDMLALVALLTGAFLVFSTQFLAVLRRRTQLALLRVIGLTRRELVMILTAEGAVVGVVGSALGVAMGVVLAYYGLQRLGGDLGAGYFRALAPELHANPSALAVFFVLGIVFAVCGALVPAREAARREPALALKAGDEEEALRGVRSLRLPALFLASGALLSLAPAVNGLPVAGYGAIALILLGSTLAMPRVAEIVLARMPLPRSPSAALAGAQLQATPRQIGVSLAAILASFSLTVAMVVMIGSFRVSLASWLDQMLPADVYVRSGRVGDSGFFTREEQQRLERAPGVERVVFIRSQNVVMRPELPAVTLLVRPIDGGGAADTLPLMGPQHAASANEPPPAWISEVAADLLRLSRGDRIDIPIGNAAQTFTVAGIWRDYARQNGAIVIDRARYIALTGDDRANDAAVFLASGVTTDAAAASIRAALGDPEGIEIAPTRDIKSGSLAVFDRTFAVTYALELAAVVIGLFGVSASFSAQALARRREFGVLRHVGMTRRQVAAMLAYEGFAVGGLGLTAGLAIGWLVSLILVHVVNRQSFHWSMDMHVPWVTLAALAALTVALAALTAVVSGRRAMGSDVLRAVREDW